MIKETSNLQKALAVLLYDQFDCPDVEAGQDDETMIQYIIYALIEKNENICPFKNYLSVPFCKTYKSGCEKGLMIDCGADAELVWKEFIRID
ncbi:hypothetical protein LNN31_13740 [Acetobacterium wieringae]|uniref:Uncharacterized protein n=1 Tax=Acetobacterium wieringae TaxID=52694 RepID=A0ABY6HBF4_9FIRM|nr:hypothetical protein [Acetobacterium wieringae]UYO61837.1 hypothetical protein LNN31_13740 [Acetobacterium wieringae]